MTTSSSKPFEILSQPDAAKEEMCRSLLAEFGAVSVTVRGEEMITRCVMPWHDDRHPSASLNYKKLVYKCLSCGASGGLLWLIGTVRNTSGKESRRWVEEQAGIGGSEFNFGSLLTLFDALYADGNKPAGLAPIPTFSTKALEPWMAIHPWLTTGAPDLGIEGRGIPEQTLRDMRVGYEPRYPMGAGKPSSERIIIPHFWKSNLVGWQTRRLWNDGTPKYKSTPDFPKDRTIYDYDPKRRMAVVVESPMSVLRHRHHLPIEATFGASVTDRQTRLIAAHEKVILWMDNDSAGWKATGGWDEKRIHLVGLGERLQSYCEVAVVDSPWAADAGDMDDETAETLCAEAVPYALWQIPTRLLCWVCKQDHPGACG